MGGKKNSNFRCKSNFPDGRMRRKQLFEMGHSKASSLKIIILWIFVWEKLQSTVSSFPHLKNSKND